MLPSADSIGAENHHRKPNGIPLDSVTAENALMRTLEKVRTEMSLHVLAYNLKRMITILGAQPLIQAMRAA